MIVNNNWVGRNYEIMILSKLIFKRDTGFQELFRCLGKKREKNQNGVHGIVDEQSKQIDKLLYKYNIKIYSN